MDTLWCEGGGRFENGSKLENLFLKLGLAASQNPYLLNDLLKSEGSSFEKLTHEVYIYHFAVPFSLTVMFSFQHYSLIYVSKNIRTVLQCGDGVDSPLRQRVL
jgi:hypothetical protein